MIEVHPEVGLDFFELPGAGPRDKGKQPSRLYQKKIKTDLRMDLDHPPQPLDFQLFDCIALSRYV
jgi:hypothetical protein